MTLHLDIPIYLLAGEFVIYALFLLCWRHARQRGPGFAGELFGGFLFGLVLEYVNVTFITGYHYGAWLVMVGPIPIGVAVGWAVIMYTAMLTSDRFGLPRWAAPFADTLLAITIDLSMDAVAIRLGLWVWEWPPQFDKWTAQWFGVPYANFFGWLLVVLLYSAFSRLLRANAHRVPAALAGVRAVLFPVLAVALSEVVLFAILRSTTFETPYFWMMAGLIVLSLVVTFGAWARRVPVNGLPLRSDLVALSVPLYYHIFFLLGLLAPLPDKPLILLPISLTMAALGLWVHVWPERARLGLLLRRMRGERQNAYN